MIRSVTVEVDILSVDASVAGRLLGATGAMAPGVSARVPGGALVFRAAILNGEPGEASVYRFVLQAGSANALAQAGTWLFTKLRGEAAALSIAGRPVPLAHGSILAALRRAA